MRELLTATRVTAQFQNLNVRRCNDLHAQVLRHFFSPKQSQNKGYKLIELEQVLDAYQFEQAYRINRALFVISCEHRTGTKQTRPPAACRGPGLHLEVEVEAGPHGVERDG